MAELGYHICKSKNELNGKYHLTVEFETHSGREILLQIISDDETQIDKNKLELAALLIRLDPLLNFIK